MAKKKANRARPQQQSDFVKIPSQFLGLQGRQALAQKKFTAALEIFKHLLKRGVKPEWQDLLVEAYWGRARELAAKGMYKEAIVIWENMTRGLGNSVGLDCSIAWLINAGQHLEAAKRFAAAEEQLKEGRVTEEIRAAIAGLIVSGRKDILAVFSPQSCFVTQYQAVQRGLAAYSEGNDDTAREELKKIPFRSPYRDFRWLINALIELDSNPQAAADFLGKIPNGSPMHGFVRAIEPLLLDRPAAMSALAKLDRREREFTAKLTGASQGDFQLVADLNVAKENPAKLFNLLISHIHQLDREAVQKGCLDLLCRHPDGIRLYEKHFGNLSPLERNRISALASETKGARAEALKYWEKVTTALDDKGQNRDGQRLDLALVLRRMAKLAGELGRTDTFYFDEPHEYLELSLHHDPKDKESYLAVLSYHKDNKDYQHWLAKAMEVFPEDIDILFAALEDVISRKVFKKATGLAQKILALDPINTRASTMLIETHLAQGRKLATSGKFAQARKEMATAASFERPGRQDGIVQLDQGLVELHDHRAEAGQVFIDKGLALAGGGVAARFVLVVEARLFYLSQRLKEQYDKDLKGCRTLARGEVQALSGRINRYRLQGVTWLDEVLALLAPLFKKIVSSGCSVDEARSLCDSLHAIEDFSSLRIVAGMAEKQWPDRPAFLFYRICGEGKGLFRKVSKSDRERLRDAHEQAMRQGDRAVANMIDDVLDDFPYDFPFDDEFLDRIPPGRLLEALAEMTGRFFENGDEDGSEEDEDFFPFPRRRRRKQGGKKIGEKKPDQDDPVRPKPRDLF